MAENKNNKFSWKKGDVQVTTINDALKRGKSNPESIKELERLGFLQTTKPKKTVK